MGGKASELGPSVPPAPFTIETGQTAACPAGPLPDDDDLNSTPVFYHEERDESGNVTEYQYLFPQADNSWLICTSDGNEVLPPESKVLIPGMGFVTAKETRGEAPGPVTLTRTLPKRKHRFEAPHDGSAGITLDDIANDLGLNGFWDDFADGIVYGDFADNDGIGTIVGQVVGGIVPVYGQAADARDVVAATEKIWENPVNGWSWLGLGMAGVGFVPLFGDAAKGVLKHGDELIDGLSETRRLDDSLDKTFRGGLDEGDFNTASRLKRGLLGEKLATESLATKGHTILDYKPNILGTNQGGIDIVTMKDNYVYMIDNKALSRNGNVSSVSALTTNFPQNSRAVRQSLHDALDAATNPEQRRMLTQAIEAIDAGRVRKAVTNANVAPDGKYLTGVTERLQGEQIEFIDVVH